VKESIDPRNVNVQLRKDAGWKIPKTTQESLQSLDSEKVSSNIKPRLSSFGSPFKAAGLHRTKDI